VQLRFLDNQKREGGKKERKKERKKREIYTKIEFDK
jgi:hypothetical protein